MKPLARYLGSLGLAVSAIALSVMFLVDMPAGDIARAETVRLVAAEPAAPAQGSGRVLKASDLDISKTVAVNVVVPAGQQVEAQTSALPAARLATVTTAVNLRSAPCRTSARVGGLGAGAEVRILRSEKGWTLVDEGGGQQGWLASRFLAE